MNIGMITCNYFMRIYNYVTPDPFDWGAMCEKYRAEFSRADFIALAGEIREMGYNCLEIWEPTFSHMVYSEADARSLAEELAGLGFQKLAYCIGGWGANDAQQVEKAYLFAKALGAGVVTGCIHMPGADVILPEVERCGKKYGILYAIENHPAPSIESPEDVARICAPYSHIGANLDTGIYNMLGYDVLAAADLLKDKTYHIHFKDTIKGSGECFPIGDGDCPVDGLLRKLKGWKYDKMISVEYEAHKDPAPGLKKSIAFINSILSE